MMPSLLGGKGGMWPGEEDQLFWGLKRTPITAASFLPPAIPNPRPWQRVAVFTTSSELGERKIWKRVGRMGPTSEDRRYATSAAELHTGGAGQRKRRRDGGHVPAWGDARWDKRVRDLKDGRWDLVEARVAVTEARRTAASVPEDTPKPATFAADSLRYVPRKRHNSRVPIEPPKTSAPAPPMIADDQPLIVFDEVTLDLDALAEEAVVKQADDKQMRRRSTRRMSRRISLAPIAEADGEAPALTLSPVKAAAPYATPLKRRSLAKMTPRKVAMSPVKLFTVSATPERVVIEKRDARPLSPVTETTAAAYAPVSAPAAAAAPTVTEAPAPLVFDQPVPDVVAEPEHEAKRRVSLHKARRRSLRRSSGVVRVADFATVKMPNRRHSFLPRGLNSEDSKGRRHTLDLTRTGVHDFKLHVTPPSEADGAMQMQREQDQADSAAEGEPKDTYQRGPAVSREAAVYVDVRTNLDIFGQWQAPVPEKTTLSSESREISGQQTAPEHPASPSTENPRVTARGAVSTPSPTKSASIQNTAAVDSPAGGPPQQEQLVDTHIDCPSSSADIEGKTEDMGNALSKLQPFSSSPPTSAESSGLLLTNEDAEPSQASSNVMTDSDPACGAIGDNPAPYSDVIPAESDCVTTEKALHVEPVDSSVEQEIASTTTPDGTAAQSAGDSLFPSQAHAVGVPPETTSAPAEASLSGEAGRVHQSDASTASLSSANADTEAHEAAPLPRDVSPANSESDTPDLICSPIRESDDATTSVVQDYEPTLPMDMDDAATTPAIVDTCPAQAVELDSNDTEHLDVTPPPPVSVAEPSRLPENSRDQAGLVFSTPPSAGGFTPINGRSSLSPKSTPPPYGEDNDTLTASLDVDPLGPNDDDNDDDNTNVFATDEAHPPPEKRLSLQEDSETEMLRKFVTRVRADKTAKEAAAAAAAAAASRAQLKRPKRRSGSTGSLGTTSSGSPMSRNEGTAAAAATPVVAPPASAAARRLPLGEKDLNMSPSPVKKRKAQHDEVVTAASTTNPAARRLDRAKTSSNGSTKSSLLSKPDLDDTSPPRPKRRRRKMEAEDTDSVFNPEFATRPSDEANTAQPPPPRRSTRTRASRQVVQSLRPAAAAAPSASAATATALSLIPVRLPGSLNLGAGDEPFTTRGGAGDEKDLAAVTRVNTRKNKAGSEPVRVVLERLATDPARRYKELKSVFEAREAAAAAAAAAAASAGTSEDDSGGEEQDGSKESAGGGKKQPRRRAAATTTAVTQKSVRWDAVLARVQGEDEPLPPPVPQMVVMRAVTGGLDEPVENTAVVDTDMEDAAAETLEVVVVPRDILVEDDNGAATAKKTAAPPEEKKPAVRRTRASRLQPPTPRKAIASISAATSSTTAAAAPLPVKSSAATTTAAAAAATATPAAVAKEAKAAAGLRMTTRRTKIATLGMSGNGTPAPKRRSARTGL